MTSLDYMQWEPFARRFLADVPQVESQMVAAMCKAMQWTADYTEQRLINNPITNDFIQGVPLEAAHQRERWGEEHDAGKSPFDWFWLIGYLAQKAAASAVAGDKEKALHHTISTAAALANWHAHISGKSTTLRPGIAPPSPLECPECRKRANSLDQYENECG